MHFERHLETSEVPARGSKVASQRASAKAHLAGAAFDAAGERQELEAFGRDREANVCSPAPIPRGRWGHVGIHLGLTGVDGEPGVDLFIDGVRSVASDGTMVAELVGCDADPLPFAPADNPNPWSLGASTSMSSEGETGDNRSPLLGGAIDHLRISSGRRVFTVR